MELRNFHLYSLFRNVDPIYWPLYNFSEYNRENKLITSWVLNFLALFNYLIIISTGLFSASKIKDLSPVQGFFRGNTFTSPFYAVYESNDVVYLFMSLILGFAAFHFRRQIKLFRKEALLCQEFHQVIHDYRNFTNDVIKLKKKGSAYQAPHISQSEGTERDNQEKLIRLSYQQEIKRVCTSCRSLMRQLTNDEECYVEYTQLTATDSPNIVELAHIHAEPTNNLHQGKHPSGLKLRTDQKPEKAKTLYQYVLSQFLMNSREAENGSDFNPWNQSFLSNDAKGNPYFDDKLVKDGKLIKSLIIVPITFDGGIAGFFTLNAFRTGMLRHKYRNIVAAHADLIAVLLRRVMSRPIQ